MAEAAAVGIPPLQFWDSTYRELYAAFQGDAIRRRRDRQEAISAAWHGAAFERSKRLPDIRAILRKMEPMREMTNHELRASILGIAKAMGATVEYRKRVER